MPFLQLKRRLSIKSDHIIVLNSFSFWRVVELVHKGANFLAHSLKRWASLVVFKLEDFILIQKNKKKTRKTSCLFFILLCSKQKWKWRMFLFLCLLSINSIRGEKQIYYKSSHRYIIFLKK